LTASFRGYRLAKLLAEDYVVQNLTVAILVLNLFIPTVFAQKPVEQKEPGASPGCVEIINGTERHCEKFTAQPSATQTALLALLAACQASKPAPHPPERLQVDAPIVSIEYGSLNGIGVGYNYSQTIIQAGMMRSVLRTNDSLNGNRDMEHPDKKSERKITTEQWERAKAAIDLESFFVPVRDSGCPQSFDAPVDWVTVEYSSGLTESVRCDSGCPATDMEDRIKAALAQAPGKDALHRPHSPRPTLGH